MSERFFVDQPIHGEWATLTDAEAHHLIHVMRAKPGTQVILFDGHGSEFLAEVRTLRRSEADLAVIEQHDVDRELPRSLVAGIALPKGDRQKWLIEKLTETGVGKLVPLRTVRSVAQPGAESLDRLRRTVIEASKQCGRNQLMQLCEPQDWSAFVDAAPPDTRRFLAHPCPDRAAPSPERCEGNVCPATAVKQQVTLAIGPEGGFTAEEVAQAVSAGWTCVDLGPRILRIETAALILAGLIAQGR